MSSVGFHFPAKDEILTINKETRAILAPMGYNNTICNYGDIGVASVYFLIDRYLGGKTGDFDVFNSTIRVFVKAKVYASTEGIDISSSKRLYSSEIDARINEGLVFLEWNPDEELTATNPEDIGNFEIAL
jgi:hypothetical protein